MPDTTRLKINNGKVIKRVSNEDPDDYIASVALKYKSKMSSGGKVEVVSRDRILRIYAKSHGVETIDPTGNSLASKKV